MSERRETSSPPVQTERTYLRFSVSDRWEHFLLILSFTVLLLTGLPQKYRAFEWSQQILATPERVDRIQTIHHIAAIILTLEVIYYLGKIITQLVRRQLPGDLLITLNDFHDAWLMIKYLLFISKEKPKFGKFNFEQKFTYWFLFFGIGILVITGFIIWFPITATRILPGGIIPASKLAHSTESIVAAIFIVIWHFYHVHIERLNLSIFTGKLSETEMYKYHRDEYNRINGLNKDNKTSGEGQF